MTGPSLEQDSTSADTSSRDEASLAEVSLEEAPLDEAPRDGRDLFLATLSHELRNPLAAILGAAQLMGQCGLENQMAEQARDVIERQSRQMVRMLDDLLNVLRVSRGRIELQKELLELGGVLREAVHSVRGPFGDRQQRLLLSLPGAPIYIEADATRLHQILVSLLSNATKYTQHSGSIRVWIEQVEREAVIHVADNGIGIQADMLEAIFEPFFQGSPTQGECDEHGLGMGLALVRDLLKLHAGRIEAFSQGPGQGSEFVVHLPTSDQRPPRREADPSDCEVTMLRIVLVEDNADARDMLCALLELDGHQVETAIDGVEGAALIQAIRPDVALIDIGLPKLDGYQVAQAIRGNEQCRGVYLVALTGYGQPQDQQQALAAGFDAHQVKPVDFDKLRRLLAESQA